jgi:hypothetical protein
VSSDAALQFEREKWADQRALQERDLRLRERDVVRSKWTNPLVIAIFTAAAAAVGNFAVSLVNGQDQANIERIKAEQALVLEAIKTTPDKAAENLDFLVSAGLISDRTGSIRKYLSNRHTGQGPSLPTTAPQQQPLNQDETLAASLPANNPAFIAGKSVGILLPRDRRGACSAFLIAPYTILTAGYCLQFGNVGYTYRTASGDEIPAEIQNASGIKFAAHELTYGVLKLSRDPHAPPLQLSDHPPRVGDPVMVVAFGGLGPQRVSGVKHDCTVTKVEENTFNYGCHISNGAGGGPLVEADGKTVIGIVDYGGADSETAERADRVRAAIAKLPLH